MGTRRQAGVTTEDRSVRRDDTGVDADDDIEELRRCNPVDADALPSSRSPEATRTLEQILESDDEPEPADQAPADLPADPRGQAKPPPRAQPRKRDRRSAE